MESKFECFVPYTAPVTRELVLSLSTQLRRLAEREHGANETDISSGITLFCGADAMRFSSEEELAAHVPPLARIDGFHLSVLLNPWRMQEDAPSLSFHVHKAAGSEEFIITAEAAAQARAQELGLEIEASLPALRGNCSDEPANPQDAQHGSDDDQRHYGKFFKTKKVIAFIAAAAGLVSSIVTIALAWPDILRFFSGLFHMQP